MQQQIQTKLNNNPHGQVIGQGDFKYKVNAHWGVLDSATTPVENCHGMAIDSKGRIIMVTDTDKNNFIVYNKDGKLLDAWGSQFPGIHAVKIVEENGEDFMYVVDSGWILNRHWDGVSTDEWDSPRNKVIAQNGSIAKLTMDGRVIFMIGHPCTQGIYTPDMPFRPTDVAIAPNGDLYVTDGYGSDYLIQYDSQGRYIRHWGGHDNSDSNYNLVNTHGIEVDLRNPSDPHLIVSSRFEQALKRFELNGSYRDKISTPGAYIGGPIFKKDYFLAPVCWSHFEEHNAVDSGFISVFDKNNRIVSNLGGTEAVYKDDQLQPMCSTWDVFNHAHAICIDDDENVYVGQWRANNTYPFKLERV
ncbi:Type I secretion outer membrane protein, TolC [Catenovulum agarivorans DS-2]|uniref:Type I secretion outer membrane protein, TolC n=1 Tax=Catenovulum agarivorans DS-2 TaxID=1328313 RepID=W7Q975_9ALTE|nr:peptidylglycine monooxygenase [Catenovulum agarivorans]EWH08556.1 Type I secretion outer membrane protein, TolC [Catenovulum agarivorans DS-2]